MFGVIAVDKPEGWTSRDVVNRVQGLIRPHKVGHTGTLDPMASGVLLLAIGPATRLVEFSHLAVKSYQAEFRLGCTSDTLDIEAEVRQLDNAPTVRDNELRIELANWIGEQYQIPPRFSAVHVAGRRAHELARGGKSFDLAARRIHIYKLELLGFEYPHFSLSITCSTGTYVRSLGSDIARSLQSDAVMTRLVRTSIGSLQLETCCRLEELDTADKLQRHLLSPLLLVEMLPRVQLSPRGCEQIRKGIPVSAEHLSGQLPEADRCAAIATAKSSAAANTSAIASASLMATSSGHDRQLAAVDEGGRLVAILTEQGGRYRSLRVFQNTSDTSQPSKTKMPHSPES